MGNLNRPNRMGVFRKSSGNHRDGLKGEGSKRCRTKGLYQNMASGSRMTLTS